MTAAKQFHLHARQSQAFTSAATEILYGGSAGGGKSHLLRVAAIAWCVAIPGLQVYLFRRTSPDLVKNHVLGPSGFPALLADWIQAGIVKPNYGTGTFKFSNGSNIILCHCQYETDLLNYQGAEIHVLMIDEITHFTGKMYKYLRGRNRLGGLPIPDQYKGQFPRIVVGGNPGGVGHSFVKMSWVDGCSPTRIRKMPRSEGGMLRQYIPAKLTDNPTLMLNDPDYADKLFGLGDPVLVRAMLEGDWNIVAGGMFDDVWRDDKHFIEPFAVPPSWAVDRAFDWGNSKPFSVGWWAESDGTEAILADGTRRNFVKGTLFRISEWYGWNGEPNKGLKLPDSAIAQGIVLRQKQLGIHMRCLPGPADSSIFDELNGDSPALIQERHGVRWQRADKRPGSRVRGWAVARERFIASRDDSREVPGVYIFNVCHQFKRTVTELPRDAHNSDDVDTDAEDHIGDEFRYRLLKTANEAMSINAGHATNG